MVSCGGEDTGNTGNSGDTGNSGNTGNSGDTADTGDSGDTGNSGNSGNSGNELLSAVYSSGTRLKVRYIESPDGAKVFRGIWDSELNTYCGFNYFSDGKHRCLEMSPYCSLLTVYNNDSCTSSKDIIACSKNFPEGKYAVAYESDYTIVHGQITKPIDAVYKIGSVYKDNLFSLSGENCVDAAEGYKTNNNLYSLDSEVPFSTFQEGSIKTLE